MPALLTNPAMPRPSTAARRYVLLVAGLPCRILLTGFTRNSIANLLGARPLVRDPARVDPEIHAGVELARGDLRDAAAVARAMDGVGGRILGVYFRALVPGRSRVEDVAGGTIERDADGWAIAIRDSARSRLPSFFPSGPRTSGRCAYDGVGRPSARWTRLTFAVTAAFPEAV